MLRPASVKGSLSPFTGLLMSTYKATDRGSHCPFFETGFAIFNSSSKNLMATIGDRKVSAILAKIRDSQTLLISPIKSPQKNSQPPNVPL